MTKENSLQNYTLWPLFNEIKSLASNFSHLDYSHVYRQQNQDVDKLSKDGVEMVRGSWKIFERAKTMPTNIFMSSGF
jgi:hypothetical protein